MPEFVLEGRNEAARTESAFVLGFIEAMFFTSNSPAYAAEEWFSDECKQAREDGTADGELPGDVGYTDLHPDALAAIRAFCERMQQEMAGLLEEAYNVAPYKVAALNAGWSRIDHSGMFSGPTDSETRIADYESWQELCECEGIEPAEEYSEEQAGRDLWYTIGGQGCGYWDRETLTDCGYDLGERLSVACGRKEINPFFGDHVKYGNEPFVHVSI